MQHRTLIAAVAACLTLSSHVADAQDVSSQRRFSEGGRNVEIEITGRVEFTDDSRAIESQAPGSRFSMTESGAGIPTRRIELNASPEGAIERLYRVNGAPAAFDAAAQRWFEETLRETIRRTSSMSVTTSTSNSTSRTENSRGPEGSSSSSSSATAEPPFQ